MSGEELASTHHHDVVIVADFSVQGDRGFRYAGEVTACAQSGARVGLVNLGAGHRRIGQAIAALVRRDAATPLGSAEPISADHVVIHAPAELTLPLPRLLAQRVTLVLHTAADIAAAAALVPQIDGVAVRIATTTSRLWALASAQVTLEDGLWRATTREFDTARPALRDGGPPTLGWLACAANAAMQPIVGTETLFLDLDGHRGALASHLATVDLSRGHATMERLLTAVTALAFFPGDADAEIPEAIIGAALANGVPVFASPSLAAHLGRGLIYCELHDLAHAFDALVADQAELRKWRRAARSAVQRWPAPAFGSPGRPPVKHRPVPAPPRPVIMMAGGGAGLGHTMRLLAIARRLPAETPVLFICQSGAVAAPEKAGYMTLRIPSAEDVGGDRNSWEDWLTYQLEKLIEDYDAGMVVFDGESLHAGLIRAVAGRADCRLAWVRHGLRGITHRSAMTNARWCDLLIEPGELDGHVDDAAGGVRRSDVALTPPILFVEKTDLVPRDEALKLLGLNADRPAVLVQLGNNAARDTTGLLERVVMGLLHVEGLQICVAEFSPHGGINLPGVTLVHGFPVAQCFRAFDVAVMAPGYSSFHEAVAFGLPTIFVPGTDPMADDQVGRSAFAQKTGAAFELAETRLGELPDLVRFLLDEKGRHDVRANAERLRRPNGAKDAADLLSHLMVTA